MKRLTQSLIVVLFLLTVVPVQLFASTVITSDPIEAKAAADKEAARVMIERLEVIKSLVPSMEGDAVGGTMNLVMKTAPRNFMLTANGSTGFSTLFSSSRPFTEYQHGAVNAKMVALRQPAHGLSKSQRAMRQDYLPPAIPSKTETRPCLQ